MTKQEIEALRTLIDEQPWFAAKRVAEYLDAKEVEENATEANSGAQRSMSQNRALHLYAQQLADELNAAGYDMKATLKPDVDIEWDKEMVKRYIIHPIMRAKFGKESTKELDKGEVTIVYEHVNRLIGERCGVHIPFPHMEAVQFAQMDNMKNEDYPEYHGKPTI